MSQFVLPGEQPFALQVPLASAEQPVSTPEALALETLEHGAYYAGKVGVTPTVARWHAKKRRFVFAEFTMGQSRLRSLAHVADSDRRTEERFVPLSRPEPQNSYRVSDYAFETAG
jgi:hypothetical protein